MRMLLKAMGHHLHPQEFYVDTLAAWWAVNQLAFMDLHPYKKDLTRPHQATMSCSWRLVDPNGTQLGLTSSVVRQHRLHHCPWAGGNRRVWTVIRGGNLAPKDTGISWTSGDLGFTAPQQLLTHNGTTAQRLGLQVWGCCRMLPQHVQLATSI